LADNPVATCDIIIVTCNQLEDTARCLESIEKNTAGAVSYRYVFVDNNSTDGTLEHLKKFDSSVLIENKEDVGLAKAVNQGLKKAGADYVALLSSGAVVTPNWLDILVGHLEDDPRAGAVGPMSNAAGTVQHDGAWSAETGPDEVSEYGRDFHARGRGRTAEYHRVAGFCMVMRSRLVSEIGYLDEEFGSGPFCDDDYCRRIRNAGHGILVAGDVFVYHEGGAALPRAGGSGADSPFLEQKNRDYFLRKWIPRDEGRAPENPLVSVIMATRDRKATIPTAIRSVLSQTYENLEMIVVNDGGEDVRSVIDGFGDPRITYIALGENRGKSYANNRAIDRSRGEVIAYLDDDDRWHADHLEAAVGELVKFESRMLVYTDYIRVDCTADRGGARIPVRRELKKQGNARYDPMDQGNFAPNFTVVHRRALFEIERYDEALDFWEDWDIMRRFSKHAYFVRVPEPTGEYWIDTGAPTRNSSALVDKNRDAVSRYITTKYRTTKNQVLLDLYSADGLAKSAEWARALRIYEGILGTDPEYIPALQGQADCLYNLRRYRECVKVLDQVIRQDRDYYEMYLLRSRALISDGDHEEAKKWLELALVVNPDVGGLYLLRDCYRGLHKEGSSELIESQARKMQIEGDAASGQLPTTEELAGRVSEMEAGRAELAGRVSEMEAGRAELAGRVSEMEEVERRRLEEDPLDVLLRVYSRRGDLQAKLPEAREGRMLGLVDWAVGVVTRSFDDSDYGILLPHGAWYMRQKLEPGAEVRGPSRLEKMREIAARSSDTVRREGVKSYLHHVRTKIGRRELRIVPAAAPGPDVRLQEKRAAPVSAGPKTGGGFEGLLPAIHRNQTALFDFVPKISIVMPTYNPQKVWLERAIESVVDQEYRNWELCIVDDASTESHVRDTLEACRMLDSRIRVRHLSRNQGIAGASNEALRLATGDYVTFLDHDDELTTDALFEVAKRLNTDKGLEIVYSDDAKKDESGRVYDHQFKPDWSPELLLSYSYFSHLVVYKKRLVDDLGGLRGSREPSQDYDLMLRATEATDRIGHVPKILYYWRSLETSTARSAQAKPHSIEAGRLAVSDAIARRGISGEVVVPDYAKGKNGVYKINFRLRSTPRVSIIIPTKDRLELLAKTVGSIEGRITYPDYEIIIVDTGSRDPETLEYLERSGHTVLRDASPEFNFSRANNIAAGRASGRYLLLMNNDIEVITPTLVDEMVGYLESDERIGVVGAKLLYPDRRVQHGGVVLGLNGGLSGHANKLIPGDDPGYLMYGRVARNYSAVTAALLMIRRDVYLEAGGMDERNLAVSYNDVDLCLRVIKGGHRIVYNPYALAYHHEGATKGTGEDVDDRREEDFIRSKWHGMIRRDPYYNPNLSLEDERFGIRHRAPRGAVLFVTHNLNFEGAPISLGLLARGFRERDYSVAVLSPKDGPLRGLYLSEDIEVLVEPAFFSRPDDAAGFAGAFDLVYANTVESHPAVRAAKLAGVPSVWCIRESNRGHYEEEGADFGQFANADRVLFAADATRAVYSDLERGGNFAVIPNGIDLAGIDSFKAFNPREALRRKHGFADGDVIITVVGTTAERKGQHVFAEAALRLCERDRNLHFLIVGCREGPYLDRIRGLAQGSPDRIHLVPETGDVYDYYGMSDVFVCASFVESFPRTVLEAMAFGLPIVATDVYGIPEQITDGVHGVLIPPGDPGLLAEKIEYLLQNPDVAKKYAKNAYLKAAEEYGMGRIVDEHEDLFGSVMRRGDVPE